MKKIRYSLLPIAVFLLSSSLALAGEDIGLIKKMRNKLFKPKEAASPAKEAAPAGKEKAVEVKKERRELTREEMVEHIEGVLYSEEEILNFIPELKGEKTGEGKLYYTYKGVKLEDLDKEDLKKVYARVQNEAVRIRTERLIQQMESIRRANEAVRNAEQATRIPAAVTPPQQPPKPPPTPPSTPQIPKPPPAPPSPPRR